MRKFLLASVAFGLLSSSAFADDWTKAELTAGVRTIEYTRHIPAGKQRVLDALNIINPDCTVAEDMDATISKEAEHGTAAIELAERYPYFPPENVGSKCNDKKIRMPVLTYKAAVGYSGTDVFEVSFLSPNGMMQIYRYNIKILDTGTKAKGRADLRP
jgi:hypothetical protein